ncbi:hypothetical protein L917_03476 [Phytophthora nicotianae]|uniref:Uncharacterized protein n=1 Tax=Phytophthora nicotianae TaxID=4792 RepID=W2LQF2_PHYNI|nr:hypothetical protein L917_03476 [Phytophthora nicotianae]ETM54761.1 hypothetical protein L914_01949 [Phytophthora nicotianae]
MFWRLVCGAYGACWRTWYAVHVEHKGAYSLERLQMLHTFLDQQKSSAATVILNFNVALGTPVPCLVIALVSDAIPLAPPENGPRGNVMFWARSWLIMGSFTLAVLLPMHHPGIAPIRERRVLLYLLSAGISTVYTGFHFAVALAIGFPVPFSYLTLNIVWISLLVAGLWVYVGPACRASAFVRQRLKAHAIYIYAASSLAVVYPLFYYAFLHAREHASAQFMLTFALPALKMMEKLLLYRTTCHAPDLQPVFIAFNVEVFNALFVSSCMQNAASVSVTVALMVADFMGACAALYGLRNIMLRVDELNVKMGPDATRARMLEIAGFIAKHHHLDRLVTQRGSVESQHSYSKNASAVAPWIIGDASSADKPGWVEKVKNRNNKLSVVNDGKTAIDQPNFPPKNAWGKKRLSAKKSAIIPTEISVPSPFNRGPSVEEITSNSFQMVEMLTAEERQQFVHETCRVLRRVEFLLLVEYTEVMVPLVYVIYIATVYHLPNRKFFPYLNEMSEADLINTICSVLIYGTLQLLSFILLLVALNRRFQLAPGTILRFVLGKEWRVVQSQFVLWIIYVLQSSIQHVGTDYTFKFRWLQK